MLNIEATVQSFSVSNDALVYWLSADRIAMGKEPLSKETIEGLRAMSPEEAQTKLRGFMEVSKMSGYFDIIMGTATLMLNGTENLTTDELMEALRQKNTQK